MRKIKEKINHINTLLLKAEAIVNNVDLNNLLSYMKEVNPKLIDSKNHNKLGIYYSYVALNDAIDLSELLSNKYKILNTILISNANEMELKRYNVFIPGYLESEIFLDNVYNFNAYI